MNLLKILNDIEPNGELLDTETALKFGRKVAEIACREQREICSTHTTADWSMLRTTIRNAPEPEIE